MSLTNSEEKYMLAIYRQYEIMVAQSSGSSCSMGTNDIAAELNVKAASVTEMLQRLHEKGLLIYQKGQGATLNDSGRLLALSIRRRQMLWECFLVEKLKLSSNEAHLVSVALGNVKSLKLFEKLSGFLGDPLYGVNGGAIPTVDGKIDHAFGVVLSSLDKGFSGKIVSLKESNVNFLDYLKKRKMDIDSRIRILDVCLFDQSLEVEILDNGSIFTISKKIADAIMVSK